jgi:hypothetical protein
MAKIGGHGGHLQGRQLAAERSGSHLAVVAHSFSNLKGAAEVVGFGRCLRCLLGGGGDEAIPLFLLPLDLASGNGSPLLVRLLLLEELSGLTVRRQLSLRRSSRVHWRDEEAAESSAEVPTLAVNAAVDTLEAVKKPLFWDAEDTSMFARRGMV